MFNFVEVEKDGELYKLTKMSVYLRFGLDAKYKKINNITAETLMKYFSDGISVYIDKTVFNKDGEIMPNELIAKDVDPADAHILKLKQLYTTKLKQLIESNSMALSFLDFYNFMKSQQTLNSYNYYINDDNKYQIYLDIAETNNITLIEALETYILAEAKCTYTNNNNIKINRAVKSISNTNTEDEMELIYQNILNDTGNTHEENTSELESEISKLSYENNAYNDLVILRDNLKNINSRIKDSEYLKTNLELKLNEYEEHLSDAIKSISIQKTN